MKQVRLTDLIAPSFYDLHQAIKHKIATYYWVKGGRGSTKSSFIALQIVMGMMVDPDANATVLRKVAQTIDGTIFEQYQWAVEMLGVEHLWRASRSPFRLIYLPTHQRIVFKGADDPRKVKSTKFKRGYNKYIHYEEMDEFGNFEDIDTINKSLVRGGEEAFVFYTYNPPRSTASWLNIEVELQALREDTVVHHSDYRDVPKEWLGVPFIADAEYTKLVNLDRYRYVYLGESIGTGAEVFTNITQRQITDAEIRTFDKINRGMDFGYGANAFHYTENYLHKDRRTLYIFEEIHQVRMSNADIVTGVKKINPENKRIIADSAEPRTIAELNNLGLRIEGAKKGAGSVAHGIKYLQDLDAIIIDPTRCPNTAREFKHYELERDHHGNLKGEYPDKNNHGISAVRYSIEYELRRGKWLI